MESRRRRLVLWAGAIVVVLLVVLATAPLLFRDRIESGLKARISSGVDAQVDWSGVGVSLLRSFPNLNVRVHDLVVTGAGAFHGDSLVTVERSTLVLDVVSVIRSLRSDHPVVVRSFELHSPDLRLVVLEDGLANWDIVAAAAEADPADPARDFRLTLSAFTLRDGSISLDNRQAGIQASVHGLRQSLRGDVGSTRFSLDTETSADAVSVQFAGIPYLSRARLHVRADLDVDTEAGRVQIRENRIRLNDLLLDLAGSVAMVDDKMALDLSFAAPGTEFREILSMVPAVYAGEFEHVRTAGTMAIAGWVRGEYGPSDFPALAIEATVTDGSFRYPDLPLPARDIALDLSVTNPGGHLDRTVLDLRRFHLVLGDDPVRGSLRMSTPVSDPDVRASLTGRVDLSDLGRTVKLDAVEELMGIVVADASVQARMSDLDAGRYDRIDADGTIAISDLTLRAIDLPHPLMVDEARLRLTPQHAELAAFRGRLGSSDLAMTGRLDNLLGFVLRDEELRGEASLTSRLVALDEWRSEDDIEAIPVPRNIDFVLDAVIDQITFGDLDMRDARGDLRVRNQRVTLQDFSLAMLGGGMTLTGYYETLDPTRPAFDMDLRLADLDVPAFAGLGPVQAFAPVASYAVGNISAELRLNGVLGPDLLPQLEVLSGLGSFQTVGIRLQDFPPLDRLADALQMSQLNDPGFVDFGSTLVIRDGRLHVSPFTVAVSDIAMNISGSNGLDQSLDYRLALEVPRSMLGSGAERVVTSLISQAGRTGVELRPTDVITLGAALTGSIMNPAIAVDFRGVAASAGRGVEQAVRQEADRRVEEMEQRLDAAAEETRQRAREEAERIMAEAERRATGIRNEAQRLAEVVRREGNEQADALLGRATTPAARLAARPAADRLRREAEERADRIIQEADERADALLAEARVRADLATEP